MKKLLFLSAITFFTLTTHAQTYPEMLPVEGGTFTMGDTEMEGDADEQPAHSVTLKSFKMAKTETTVLQWRTYCNATGRTFPSEMSGKADDVAMAYVNYGDAVGYCDWLSDKTGQLYRLPTEAEWEYAARGGKLSKGFKYSGAQSIDVVGWYKENCSGIQLVAQKRANELGLYDMSGNVWEWCKDWYGAYTAEAQTNPRGATSGTRRVLRGGGWRDAAAICRVANRIVSSPEDRLIGGGFRVALPR